MTVLLDILIVWSLVITVALIGLAVMLLHDWRRYRGAYRHVEPPTEEEILSDEEYHRVIEQRIEKARAQQLGKIRGRFRIYDGGQD